MNRDFNAKNEDRTSVPALFQDVMAPPFNLQFYLAKTDPNGNATKGITRTYTTQTSFSSELNDAKKDESAGKSPWPACDYLNIWVVPSIDNNQYLGYAQFPEQEPETDGLVISHPFFGDHIGTTIDPASGMVPNFYNKGRTTTHELGHFFGLLHPYENGCNDGDYVEDTPQQAEKSQGCPGFLPYSCGTYDMFVNFMDASFDECLLTFTKGQKKRLEDFLGMPSRACLVVAGFQQFGDDVPFEALLWTKDTIVCTGQNITFRNLSIGLPDSCLWTFEGADIVMSKEYNPVVSYSQAGSYDVSLTVYRGNETETITLKNYIHILEENLCPCIEFIHDNHPAGGGPFDDVPVLCGSNCPNGFKTGFEVWPGEAYILSGLLAGNRYLYDICSGINAGSWPAIMTITRFDGKVIGDIVAYHTGCSISFEVPSNGDYLLIITEQGYCEQTHPEKPNGNLSVRCLKNNNCQCEMDIRLEEDIGYVCSGEPQTLSVSGNLGTAYNKPNFAWLATRDAGMDGILLTEDDFPTYKCLNSIQLNNLQQDSLVVFALGNQVEMSFDNQTCDSYPVCLYVTIIDEESNSYNPGLCDPYPVLPVHFIVEPEAQGINVLQNECVYSFESSCKNTLDISPETYTIGAYDESLIVRHTSLCGTFYDTLHLAACNKNFLPIDILSFKGESIDKGILLQWETTGETDDNAYYTLEHKEIKEDTFAFLHQQEGQGIDPPKNSYSFLHTGPAIGQNEYRLFYHGSEEQKIYIGTISIDYLLNKLEIIHIYSDFDVDMWTSKVFSPENSQLYVDIINIQGQVLGHYSYELIEGFNELELSNQGFSPGIYFVRFYSGNNNGETFTYKVLK